MGRQWVMQSSAAWVIGGALGGAAWADGAAMATTTPGTATPGSAAATPPVTTADELEPSPPASPAPAIHPAAAAEQPVRSAHGREPRKGLTLELGLGAGWFSTDDYGGTGKDTAWMWSGSAAVGGWISKRLALTGRVVGLTGEDEELDATTIFAGPSAQLWFGERLWISGGAGLAIAAIEEKDAEFSAGVGRIGAGMDLRAGYTHPFDPFAALHLSVEATPWLIDGKSTLTLTLMAGLQVL